MVKAGHSVSLRDREERTHASDRASTGLDTVRFQGERCWVAEGLTCAGNMTKIRGYRGRHGFRMIAFHQNLMNLQSDKKCETPGGGFVLF